MNPTFLQAIGAGFVLKLFTSIDDIIWLSCMMQKNHLFLAGQYILGTSLMIGCGTSLGLVLSGVVEAGKVDDNTRLAVSLLSSLLLMLYGFYSLTDGKFDCCGKNYEYVESGDEKNFGGAAVEPSITNISVGGAAVEPSEDIGKPGPLDPATSHGLRLVITDWARDTPSESFGGVDISADIVARDRDRSVSRAKIMTDTEAQEPILEDYFGKVFVVSILGAFNDFLMYTTMVLESDLEWYGLILGGTAACLVVVSCILCITLGTTCTHVYQFPDFTIFFTLSAYIAIVAVFDYITEADAKF